MLKQNLITFVKHWPRKTAGYKIMVRYEDLTIEQKRGLCFLYKDGGFDSEAKLYLAELGIGFVPKMWKDWLKDDVFAEDLDAFREYAKAFWERMLRENIGNKGFNLPAWYKAVQYRWDEYAEKPTISIDASTNIYPEVQKLLATGENYRLKNLALIDSSAITIENGE